MSIIIKLYNISLSVGKAVLLMNMMSNFYHGQNVVHPRCLKSVPFKTRAMDNIDHNRPFNNNFHGAIIYLK
jgi:hypothetical protein